MYNFAKHMQTLSKTHTMQANNTILLPKEMFDQHKLFAIDAVESGVGADGRKYFLCHIQNTDHCFYADRELSGYINLWLNDLRTIENLNTELAENSVLLATEEATSATGTTYYRYTQPTAVIN